MMVAVAAAMKWKTIDDAVLLEAQALDLLFTTEIDHLGHTWVDHDQSISVGAGRVDGRGVCSLGVVN
jgi:hypothetical protein